LDNLTGTGKVQSRDMSRNIRQEKGLFLPRRIFFALILFLFTVLNVQPLKAQQPFPKQNKPILKTDGQSTDRQSFFPGLTEEQAKAIENLQRTYAAEAFPVRMELMCLRLELRHLIRDPKVQARILFDHQRKISALQSRLEELSLSYQVKAKSVFTKEQWGRLPQDWLLGMDTEYEPGMGVGRGPRREPKW
jgi:hypothetical protein